MIRIVRARDASEKSFRYFKSNFMISRTGTHSDSTYTGKMFVALIALVTLQSFRWFTKSLQKT